MRYMMIPICSKSCRKNTENLNTKISKLTEELSDCETDLYNYKSSLSQVEASRPSPSIYVSKGNSSKLGGNNFSAFEQRESSSNIMSKPMVKFVKETGCFNAIKVNNTKNARKTTVKYAEIYRNISQSPKDVSNNFSPPIIKDWDFEDESEVDYTLNKTIRPNIEHVNVGGKNETTKQHKTNCGIWVATKDPWARDNHSQNNMKFLSTYKSIIPRAVLLKTGTKPIVVNKPKMNVAQPKMTSFVKTAHLNVKRPFERKSAVKNQIKKIWVPKVPTGRTNIPTVDLKVPTAKPTVAANLGNKGKAVKASAYWIWKPKQNTTNQGLNFNGVLVIFKKYQYINIQGRLKYMIDNISYLSEYEPYDGGYVSFGHGGGKITGKGIIKTGKYFKLNDDAYVLLRTPRQHNMYSIDLNNSVPHKNLTYLVAKDSVDESMMWHRRLGHLNFKTMNKLVRNNLVKGLPSKSFENDHSCVACLKGKQHKASLVTDDFSRCDNGGEFKNREMDEFYTKKGKFDAKGYECYFVGYSLSSKAFRVFNKRTNKVEKNLHVDFLENQPIEKGAGPNWLFDIDTLTKSMNYVPVVAGTSSTNILGTKENINQVVKENVSSLRFIALPNWFHEAHMETSNDFIRNSEAKDDTLKEQDSNADVPESSGNTNPTATTKDPLANYVEVVLSPTLETIVSTVSSPVPTASTIILSNESSEPLSSPIVETVVPTVSTIVPPVSSSGPRIILKGVHAIKKHYLWVMK
ncbi:ribonuclease H-like domain-containing protein [Tanacetum coccineum]